MTDTQGQNEDIISVREASQMFGVKTKAAIYQALYLGKLKGKREKTHWQIKKSDLIAYHKNKYNSDSRIYEGRPIYSMEKGELSPLHVAKLWGSHRTYIYFLIRRGYLPAFRKGKSYVIKREDAVRVHKQLLLRQDQRQLKFA
jgi:excisionase family DNA binding protein